jgi:peptide/nickel transport system substrate-binding protein
MKSLLFGLWALTCVACSGGVSYPGAPSDRIVVLLDSAVKAIDPRFVVDSTTSRVSRLVVQALVTVDTPDASPRPELAEWVEPDANDPRLWRCKLRSGVTFHDGSALDAEDVVATYRSVIQPNTQSPLRSEFASRIREVRAAAGDPLLVEFRLEQQLATFRTDLVLGILPSEKLTNAAPGPLPDDHVVGTGPFRFGYRENDKVVVLERARPSDNPISKLVFRVVAEESTRVLALLSGSAQFVQNGVTPVLLGVLEREPRLRVQSAPSTSLTYLGLNLRQDTLAHRNVRRAIALALDRQTIVDHRFRGTATLARSLLPPFHWAAPREAVDTRFDPRGAEVLLDSAGFPRDPHTGIRFSLELKLSSNRFRQSIGRLIVSQLAAVGIEVKLRAFEFSTFFADVRAGRFEMFLLQLPEAVEPDLFRWMLDSRSTPTRAPDPQGTPFAQVDRRVFPPDLFGADQEADCDEWVEERLGAGIHDLALLLAGLEPELGQANRFSYYRATVDCLLSKGRRELNIEKRRKIYEEVDGWLQVDIPFIPLWHEDHVVVSARNLEGFDILPTGRLSGLANAVWSNEGKR